MADNQKPPAPQLPEHVFYDWRDPMPADLRQRVLAMRELWEHETHIARHYYPEKAALYRNRTERSKGHLYGGIGEMIASGTIGSSKTFDLIVMALNTLPELVEAWLDVHGKDTPAGVTLTATGRPGSGKTLLLTYIREILEDRGFAIRPGTTDSNELHFTDEGLPAMINEKLNDR